MQFFMLWQDIDCMPQNPYENMPTLLAGHIDALDLSFENTPKHKVKAQSNESMKFSSGVLENGDGFLNLSPMNFAINNLLTQTKVSIIPLPFSSLVTHVARISCVHKLECDK